MQKKRALRFQPLLYPVLVLAVSSLFGIALRALNLQVVSSALYLTLMMEWCLMLQRRIMDKRIRSRLLCAALLMVLLLLMFSLFNLLRAIRFGKKDALVVLCIAVTAVLVCGMQPLFRFHVLKIPFGFDLPVWLLILLLLLLTGTCTAQHFAIRRRMRETITAMSVKESFDNLPTGLCCWFPGGLLKLVNTKMDALSNALCGHSVQNGETFWNTLQNGDLPGCIACGEQPIYQTADGAVCSFRCYSLELDGEKAFELVAADVTQEYRLTQTLEEKQRQVQIINTRLRSLNSTMEYLNMSRELLALKVQLHDRLGQSLLYAKRYLAAPDTVDREELRAL